MYSLKCQLGVPHRTETFHTKTLSKVQEFQEGKKKQENWYKNTSFFQGISAFLKDFFPVKLQHSRFWQDPYRKSKRYT